MAFTYVTVGVSAEHNSIARDVRLLVDTGSFYSLIPRAVLEELGIMPVYRRTLRVADGRTIEREVGYAFLRYVEGHPGPTLVLFAEPDDTLVLGVHALEGMGLQVDPQSGRLSVIDAIPLYRMAEASTPVP